MSYNKKTFKINKSYAEDMAEYMRFRQIFLKEKTWSFKRVVPNRSIEDVKRFFVKGFHLALQKAPTLLGQSLKREEIIKGFTLVDLDVDVKGDKFPLLIDKAAGHCAMEYFKTGLVDVAVFEITLLTKCYEIAEIFGRDYKSERENCIIFMMMEGALTKGEEERQIREEIDSLLLDDAAKQPTTLHKQCEKTAKAFADKITSISINQDKTHAVDLQGGTVNNECYIKVVEYAKDMYRKLNRKKG